MMDTARKPTLLESCAAEVGVHPNHLRDWLRHARWTADKLRTARSQPGWFDQVKTEALEAELDDRVSTVGPPTFQSLSDDQALAKLTPRLRAWVERYDGRSAVLLGRTGIGKSLAAFIVLRRIKRKEARAHLAEVGWQPGYGHGQHWSAESAFRDGWIGAQDLLTAYRGHPLGEGEAPEVQKAKFHRLVVVDDITWPPKDDLTREVLACRYDAGKVTIVTAGVPKAELFQRFGDAFSRRCLELDGARGAFIDEFRNASK